MTQPTDDIYRNATRFFTSAAQPPPLFSRDDDVTGSRDPDVALSDVIPASRTTVRLAFVCLDVVILLYRIAHVCRVVNRMKNCWSRDNRKYNDVDEDYDDDDEYWTAEMTRDRPDRPRSSGLDHVDEMFYQLSSSSSSSCGRQLTVLCRLASSPYLVKLVFFMVLLTSCHFTLQTIDRYNPSLHTSLVGLTSDTVLPQTIDHSNPSLYTSLVGLTSDTILP